jgi:hypothetical protein
MTEIRTADILVPANAARTGATRIRSSPLVFPTTYTPTNDRDAATKVYVDTHGGGSSWPQQRIIYLSDAGPKTGSTADGLTLDTAYGAIVDAVDAANAAAEALGAQVVVHCSDAAIWAVSDSGVLTLSPKVSIWAPACRLEATELHMGNNNDVTLMSLSCTTIYVSTDVGVTAPSTLRCTELIESNVSTGTATRCLFGMYCCGDITTRVTIPSVANNAVRQITIDSGLRLTFSYETYGESDTQLAFRGNHCALADGTTSSSNEGSLVRIDARYFDYTNFPTISVVDMSLVTFGIGNVMYPAGLNWISELSGTRPYWSTPLSNEWNTINFHDSGSASGNAAFMSYIIGDMFTINIGTLIVDQDVASVWTSDVIKPQWRPMSWDPVVMTTCVDNGVNGYCYATLDHATGEITISQSIDGGLFSGTGELTINQFMIMGKYY